MDKKYTKKLLSYSAIAGAFVAAGQTAEAQVVYTDFDPDTTISAFSGNPVFDVDLDNNGSVDFQITHNSFSTSYYVSGGPYSSGHWVFYGSFNAGIYMYASGAGVMGVSPFMVDTLPQNEELIDTDIFNVQSTDDNLGSFYFGNYSSNTIGVLPGAGERLLGVRFKNGADTLYGWIRISVTPNCNSITVHSFAYESQAGVGIHGGDTVGVYIGGVVPSNVLATTAQIDYTPMKGGSVYMVVQNYADPVPTEAEVISGVGAAGATLIHADTNVAVAETASFFALNGLSAFTHYKAYLVLVDDSSIVSHVIDTAFTTLDPTGINYNGITEFNVFPNPVVRNLNLQLPEASMIIVRDMSGREFIRREFEAGNQIIDLSVLQAGSYLIEAVGNNSSKTIRFIKK